MIFDATPTILDSNRREGRPHQGRRRATELDKRKEREKIALEYLDNVGLKNWASHLPSELSGGQKQRVAIARAMVSKPKVLLADEPTGALDSKTSAEVMSLIQEINNLGKTILVVTHEEDIAKMCKRVVRLKDGVIVDDKKINQKVL